MYVEVIRDDEDYGPMPISWQELAGMRQRANHFLMNGTKQERRLARDLIHTIAWIEAEGKAMQQYEGIIRVESIA